MKAIRKQTDKKKPRAKVMKVGRPPMPEAVYTKCDTALVKAQIAIPALPASCARRMNRVAEPVSHAHHSSQPPLVNVAA